MSAINTKIQPFGTANTWTRTNEFNAGTSTSPSVIFDGISTGGTLLWGSFQDNSVEVGQLTELLGFFGIVAPVGVFFGQSLANYILDAGGIKQYVAATYHQFTADVYCLNSLYMSAHFIGLDTDNNSGFLSPADNIIGAYINGAEEFRIAADSITFNNGTNDTILNWAVDNLLAVTQGNFGVVAGTSATISKVGGTINVNTTQTGNTALTETTLFSVPISGNTLESNSDRLCFTSAGTFANTASVDKRIKVQYPSGNTIFDTGALAITTANSWNVNGEITRISTSGIKSTINLNTSSATLSSYSQYTSVGSMISLTTGSTVLLLAGNGTNANDTTGEMWSVEWKSAP